MRQKPELHLITSGKQPLEEVLRIAELAYAGGMDYLHIREKQRTARECMDWAISLSEVMPLDRLLINDRADVAAAVGCRGAHLAYHSLSVQEARRVVRDHQWLGRSVHSFDEAAAAEAEGADYLIYGHVYTSASKPGLEPRGIEELKQITAALRTPVIGIGGVTPENAVELLKAGCTGVAVLSGITAADDVRQKTYAYRQALDLWKEIRK
ncbi:MAG TPA: thiamine phosphate synthase [Brevibacillus sp.]|nr:thiamine phosphate synthase [Brevibacillus sp.]